VKGSTVWLAAGGIIAQEIDPKCVDPIARAWSIAFVQSDNGGMPQKHIDFTQPKALTKTYALSRSAFIE
jgi:hypothetical protein